MAADEQSVATMAATSEVLRPDGTVLDSVYASGPVGRLMPDDVLKRVAFDVLQAAKS